ncbi:nickel-type superoxide dismutase maturation protease [Streptomyces antimicrobicus]|uniref:Nickel-type superoxide dismutase maturation protease n=1 Tax=Streptomyces antimicrobicus TaxID=2883108 RepID=A0ABS8B6C6_9ACTN|nr:nickel-type superoxide dismutase maturation protease [Streptomyces antimicrobicus]MCB5180171.1 nickel-type superoxide dismutase maturation protease [Streptomyces antimicrobicus]
MGWRVPFVVVEVYGPSMVPTLYEGDRLFVRYGATVRPGDVVLLRHPFQQDLIVVKRAVERRGGGWWVLGDNGFNRTGDSEDFGTVPEELVLAVARLRYRPRRPDQRSIGARLSWAVSALRPLLPDPEASSRLRAL